MKKLILALAVTFGLTSCSEDTIINNYEVTVENVTVEFGAKTLITENSGVFAKGTKGFDKTYVHTLPTDFTARFVCDEDRGQYKKGEVLKSLSVVNGVNQVLSLPKLKYKVYVSNYVMPNQNETQNYPWYYTAGTVSSISNQIPAYTDDILLFGIDTIDYTTVTSGTVTLSNPYSAVMVKNTSSVASAPFFNTGNKTYTLVANDSWYLLYIKNSTTSTQVPLTFNAPDMGDVYQLNKAIEPNKIYQYTIQGVGDGEGNLTVVTVPMEEGTAEIINILD